MTFYLTLATATWAEDAGWRNWFVGEGDGNHPSTVETEADAYAVYAGVTGNDNKGDKVTFGLSCNVAGSRPNDINSNDGVISRLFVSGMLSDVTAPVRLVGSFEDGSSADLGLFYFNQGALVENVRPQVLAELLSHKQIKISAEGGTFSATVSLANAGQAIAGIKCKGEMQ